MTGKLFVALNTFDKLHALRLRQIVERAGRILERGIPFLERESWFRIENPRSRTESEDTNL